MTVSPHPYSSATERSTSPVEDLDERSGDVVVTDAGPRLVGSECANCGGKNFPRRMACLECGGVDLGACELAPTGTLYSHTTVHVSGSRPTPYHLAYIDLADGVRILAQVDEAAVAGGLDAPVQLESRDDGWIFTAEAAA